MSRPTLFDTAPRQQRGRGPTSLVPAPARCPRTRCARPLVRLPTAIQPALFIHGGYGAAQRTIRDLCTGCGYVRTAAVTTINPRHLDTSTERR